MAVASTSRRTIGEQRGGPATPPAAISRPRPRRLRVEGLPPVERDALLGVTPTGDRVIVARGRTVETYAIARERDRVTARRTGRATLSGPARELTVAPDGTSYARVRGKAGGAEIVRVDGDRAVVLRATTAAPTALAATRRHVMLALPAAGLTPPQLVALRRADGAVAWREPLATADVRLRAGRGDELLVVEPTAGRARWVDVPRRLARCRPPGDGPSDTPPPTRDPKEPHHPCGCRPPRPPGGAGGSGVPPRPPRDPDDQSVPGTDGDPDGCIVTYVIGAMVVVVDLCTPGDRPCAAQLDWPAATVARTPRTLVATARDGRHVAILDARTLARIHEVRAGRGRVTALAARSADHLFLLDDAGALTLLDPAPLLPADGPAFTLGNTSAVHDGKSPLLQFDKGGVQTGVRNVLMIPMLEPGQAFVTDTEDYRSYYQFADILETARAFYEETTRGQLGLQFAWFGADTPTLYTGPPLVLPKPWRSYWGPAWDPGAIVGRVPVPGGGVTLAFSGDEVLRVNAVPHPPETYEPETFEIRFPAASYRERIPNALATITLGPGTTPARGLTVDGTDRNGAPFAISVDTSALGGTGTSVDLVRSALETGNPQEALADVIEELLASAPGHAGLFERPSVVWHDDGDDAGMLHVSLAFAPGGGGSAPTVTAFDLDDLLQELGGGSRAATFAIPGDEGNLETYLSRVVADAWVRRHPELDGDVRENYFDLTERTPSAVVEDGELAVRINLSTAHGGFGATITLDDQTGLEVIGMDDPESVAGADTGFSGSGGPQFEDLTLFDDVYTAVVDAAIGAYGGDEEAAIDAVNLFFNGVSPDGEPGWAYGPYHTFVVTPVFPTPLSGTGEPDVADLRGASKSPSMDDRPAADRAKPVLAVDTDRSKIVMGVAPDSLDDLTGAASSASTLAHELGHALLGLPDLYELGNYREQVQYVGGHCMMGSSSSRAHFCAYNQRIKGWLDDDATLLVDRPAGNDVVDQEVVLLQLEHWDATLDAEGRAALAASLLPGTTAGTPVVAAVFLRLGGDGRVFDILELRGQGARFSQGIDPPRVLVTNAIDPEDDTRYAEVEVEGAGTTEDVLRRYRRDVHLLTSALRAPGDAFDFATEPEFPEVGLRVEVLEWGTGTTAGGDGFAAARVRVAWTRGPAIDLGFVDSTPGWRSPDIAILKPEEIGEDGSFTFPEDQDTETNETYRLPGEGEGPLVHKVAVRVWNFGDASALNVQVELVLRRPGEGGDWDEEDVVAARVVPCVGECAAPLPEGASPAIVDFDWEVESDMDAHVCFRAQVGDRDVPRDDGGNALASDDTNDHNNWAQQNVDVHTARADSPPEPVELTYAVTNGGQFPEEVRLAPRGLGPGARLTISPARLRIPPGARGLFRVRVELAEWLLDARCGRDVAFVLETWRRDDHTEERWGAVKYVVKPRRRTETVLNGSILPERLHLLGHVSPDVGAQRVLLHVQRPGRPSLWEVVNLGPASTFDWVLEDVMPPGEEVRATAHFDGTREFARSASATLTRVWLPEP